MQQVTHASLNTRPIKIAARTDTHDRPGRLRRRTFADAFGRWIFVRVTSLTPTAIVILTAFEPIAAAQYPVLRHVLTNGAQPTQHLPGAVDVIDAPPSIPRAVLVLRVDQILDSIANRLRLGIEANVTEQLERARGQGAARWVENRFVIGKRHVSQPRRCDVLIKRSPTTIPALKTKLPIQRAAKDLIEHLRITWPDQPQSH